MGLFGPAEGFGSVDLAPDCDRSEAMASETLIDDLLDGEDMACRPCDGQRPIPVPSPGSHTKEEYMRHCLTHSLYRNWCPHCVKGQRHNAAHTTKPPGAPEIPSLAIDYCFVRDSEDEEPLTLLVGKMEPYKAFVALPVDLKGTGDVSVITRLAKFICDCGPTRIVIKSDQERSLRPVIEEALRVARTEGNLEHAVTEVSAVSDSQSNGRAERAVQAVEDLLRTMKLALEDRIKRRIPSTHAIMAWLVEHVANILNKYRVSPDGKTAYQRIHGRRVHERLAEFGEKILYHIPRKGRAKLDAAWKYGVYLGTTLGSNEFWVGTADGSVTRARAMNRLMPGSQWSWECINSISGTPGDPKTAKDDLDPEADEAPHEAPDDAARDREDLEGEQDADGFKVPLNRRLRLVKADFLKHGWTLGRNKCRDMHRGNKKATGMHSDACRKRIYEAMKVSGDPKLIRAMEQNPEFHDQPDDPLLVDIDPGLEDAKRESLGLGDGAPIPKSEEEMEQEVERWVRELEKDPVVDVMPAQADEPHDTMDVSSILGHSVEMAGMVNLLRIGGVQPIDAQRMAVNDKASKREDSTGPTVQSMGTVWRWIHHQHCKWCEAKPQCHRS